MGEEWKGIVVATGSDTAEQGWYRVSGKTLQVNTWRHNRDTGSNIGFKIASVELAEGDDPREKAKDILRRHYPPRKASDDWLSRWRDPGIV
jgi:hypothetical protein